MCTSKTFPYHSYLLLNKKVIQVEACIAKENCSFTPRHIEYSTIQQNEHTVRRENDRKYDLFCANNMRPKRVQYSTYT